MQLFANDKWKCLKRIFPHQKYRGKSSFFIDDNKNIIKILFPIFAIIYFYN